MGTTAKGRRKSSEVAKSPRKLNGWGKLENYPASYNRAKRRKV